MGTRPSVNQRHVTSKTESHPRRNPAEPTMTKIEGKNRPFRGGIQKPLGLQCGIARVGYSVSTIRGVRSHQLWIACPSELLVQRTRHFVRRVKEKETTRKKKEKKKGELANLLLCSVGTGCCCCAVQLGSSTEW